MDVTEDYLVSEEVIIENVLDTYDEVIVEEYAGDNCAIEESFEVEDCTVEIQSAADEAYIQIENDNNIEVAETVEIETPIDIVETEIKTEVLEEKELLIPTTECEIEIDQDINEFECIYIREQCLEDFIKQEPQEPSDCDSLSSNENNQEGFACQICRKLFLKKANLNSHMLRHASEKYFCAICDKTFKKKENLEFHIAGHTSRSDSQYVCFTCQETFDDHPRFAHHMVIHKHFPSQQEKEKVSCNICNKTFQKSYLKIHMASHMPNNDYTCTFCSKALSSKQSLYMHMNTIHANEGCYQCDYCSKRFFWKSYLDRHVTVHTKEKSHHCSFCTKAFTRKLALRKHMTTHAVRGNYFIS